MKRVLLLFGGLVSAGLLALRLFGVQAALGSWSSVPPAPAPGNMPDILVGASAVDLTHAWAVGSFQNSINQQWHMMIQKWNGAEWKLQPTPTPPSGSGQTFLYATKAVSTNEAWAVGTYDDGAGAPRTLALHTTDGGNTWRIEASPGLGEDPLLCADSSYFYGVTAPNASYVWAAGQCQNLGPSDSYALLEVWRPGVGWVVPAQPIIHNALYLATDSYDSNHVWAVGWSQSSALSRDPSPRVQRPRFGHSPGTTCQPLITFWNGSYWTQQSVPPIQGSCAALYGVSVLNANEVWATGEVDNQPLTLRWNGTSWIQYPTTLGIGVLAGVFNFAHNDAWAVGYRNDINDQIILRWNGAIWSKVAGAPAQLPDLEWVTGTRGSCAGQQQLWAVGAQYTTQQTALIETYTYPVCSGPP